MNHHKYCWCSACIVQSLIQVLEESNVSPSLKLAGRQYLEETRKQFQ
jgi:hypothetical protein